MERKRGGNGKDMKAPATAPCIPRTRGSNKVTSPVSLLQQFREMVFRLIMFSAISKRPQARQRRSDRFGKTHHHHHQHHHHHHHHHHHNDSHRSEVVDCIEFFRKSAYGDETKSSSVSSVDSVEVAFSDLHVL